MSTVARGRHVRAPRHPGVALLLRGLATVLVAVLVVAVAAGVVLVRQLDGNIQAADVESLLGDDRPEESEESYESLTILLVGEDTRSGDEFGGTGASPGLSDTTIVLHLSAERDRAQLVSIPRDSMVQMPDCTLEDGTVAEGGFRQFNSAYARGGVACVQRTIEQVTGVVIDHYAVVDFAGFQEIVNALGGVRVCVPEAVDVPKAGLRLDAGEQVIQGEQALAYVRAREGIGKGSDLERIERQQAFLSSMVQQVTSTGLLSRPDRLYGVLDAGTRSLTTDPGLARVTELARIARSVQSLPPEDVSFLTIPVEPWPEDPNRVVWTDDADLVWEAIRNDEPLPGQEPEPEPSQAPTEAPEPPAPLTVPPDAFVVDVLNAGAAGGAAGEAASDLRTQGFQVGRISNAEEQVDGVRVLVPPGQDEAARTVAAAFAGSELVRDPEVGTITVQLGSGSSPVQEVPNRLGSEPLPERAAPTPSEDPASIEVRAAADDICS